MAQVDLGRICSLVDTVLVHVSSLKECVCKVACDCECFKINPPLCDTCEHHLYRCIQRFFRVHYLDLVKTFRPVFILLINDLGECNKECKTDICMKHFRKFMKDISLALIVNPLPIPLSLKSAFSFLYFVMCCEYKQCALKEKLDTSKSTFVFYFKGPVISQNGGEQGKN